MIALRERGLRSISSAVGFTRSMAEAAKLQDIGTRAGLSMGTIYAIFPGKTELFTAILEERGREVADLVEAISRAQTSPREALDRLIEVYIGWFVEHPECDRQCDVESPAGNQSVKPGLGDSDNRHDTPADR